MADYDYAQLSKDAVMTYIAQRLMTADVAQFEPDVTVSELPGQLLPTFYVRVVSLDPNDMASEGLLNTYFLVKIYSDTNQSLGATINVLSVLDTADISIA